MPRARSTIMPTASSATESTKRGLAVRDDHRAACGQLDHLCGRQRPAGLVEADLAQRAQPGKRLLAIVLGPGFVLVGEEDGRHGASRCSLRGAGTRPQRLEELRHQMATMVGEASAAVEAEGRIAVRDLQIQPREAAYAGFVLDQ